MLALSTEARDIHQAALIIDLHCDILLTNYFLKWDWTKRHHGNPLPGAALMGHTDLPRLREGNVGCLAMGIVTSPLRGRSGPSAIAGAFDRLDRMLASAQGQAVRVSTAAEIRAARAAGKLACFAGLEGAHGLNGSLDDLQTFKDRGLGYVGLVHFTANEAARPMVGRGADPTQGLTPFGFELVDALGDLQVMVDVAHLNTPGLKEVCARQKHPVICSHTACNAVYPSVRGLDDDEIRAVADTDGVVGVIFVTPFIGPGGVEAVVAHLNHLRTTVGVAHAAIGTDWEGWSLYPDDLRSADRLPLLTEALLRAGWTAEEILGIYGENVLRVLTAIRG